mmetsp:Transcript_9295/g.30768  ORF Transcript_9295/g.30768 Transcript_9295/m.30768 type:complete len:238 (+) Transcript_9295:179-892(+)
MKTAAWARKREKRVLPMMRRAHARLSVREWERRWRGPAAMMRKTRSMRMSGIGSRRGGRRWGERSSKWVSVRYPGGRARPSITPPTRIRSFRTGGSSAPPRVRRWRRQVVSPAPPRPLSQTPRPWAAHWPVAFGVARRTEPLSSGWRGLSGMRLRWRNGGFRRNWRRRGCGRRSRSSVRSWQGSTSQSSQAAVHSQAAVYSQAALDSQAATLVEVCGRPGLGWKCRRPKLRSRVRRP